MRHAFLLLFLIFFSCAKEDNLEEILPSVTMISATPNQDGTIDLRARVNSPIEDLIIAGFCADSLHDPNIEVNQILVSTVIDNEITATLYPYGVQSEEGEIVVNAFVGNDFGLGKEEPLSVSGLNDAYDYPQLRPDCFYPMNSYFISNDSAGTFTEISNPYNPPSTFGFRIDASSATGVEMSLTFLELTTGRFSLVPEQFSYGENEMTIKVVEDGESFELQGGDGVVVSQMSDSTFRVTVCNSYFIEFPLRDRIFNATIDLTI